MTDPYGRIDPECSARTCGHRECDICGSGHGSEVTGVDGLCHACREFWRGRDIRAVFVANCEALFCSYHKGGKREAAAAIASAYPPLKAEMKYFGLRLSDIFLPGLIRHLLRRRCSPACMYTAVPVGLMGVE